MPGVNTILANDCGSTTTKAILIEKQGDDYRLTVRGEAPTTVEAPFDDVTVGVLNAVREVEELSGRRLIGDDGKILIRDDGRSTIDDNVKVIAAQDTGSSVVQRPSSSDGVDLYLS